MLIVAVSALCLNGLSNEFRGSSSLVKNVLIIGAASGFLSLFAFVIYAIFKTTWWHPIVGLLIIGAISSTIGKIIRMFPDLIADLLCLVGVVVGSCLMWAYF